MRRLVIVLLILFCGLSVSGRDLTIQGMKNRVITRNKLVKSRKSKIPDIIADTVVLKGFIYADSAKSIPVNSRVELLYRTQEIGWPLYKEFSTDSDGSFEFPILKHGDSLLGAIRIGYNNYAMSWLDGKQINYDPPTIDISESDTISLNIIAQNGGMLECEIEVTQIQSPNQYASFSLVSLDGYTLQHKSAELSSNCKITFNGIPAGQYYLLGESYQKEYSYYPNSLNLHDAKLITINNNDSINLKWEFEFPNALKDSIKNIVLIYSKAYDKDGKIIHTDAYEIRAMGKFHYGNDDSETDSINMLELSNVEEIAIYFKSKDGHYGSQWYKGDSYETAQKFTPQGDTTIINIEFNCESTGNVSGIFEEESVKLEFEQYSDITDNQFGNILFYEKALHTANIIDSTSFMYRGISDTTTTIRTFPYVSINDAGLNLLDNIPMYRGGIFESSISILKNATTVVRKNHPIASGRLDTELLLDINIYAEGVICLIDSSGYVQSYSLNDEYSKLNQPSPKDAILNENIITKKLLINDLKTVLPISLFGIGKGEYYLLSITYDAGYDRVIMQWYGETKKELDDSRSWYLFPFNKLTIPSNAKTIKFDTDSTWIKDFQWDITPILPKQDLKITDFSANVIGSEIKINYRNLHNATAKLYTLKGRLVQTASLPKANSFSLGTHHLAKGMYVLKVQSDNKTYSQQITLK